MEFNVKHITNEPVECHIYVAKYQKGLCVEINGTIVDIMAMITALISNEVVLMLKNGMNIKSILDIVSNCVGTGVEMGRREFEKTKKV